MKLKITIEGRTYHVDVEPVEEEEQAPTAEHKPLPRPRIPPPNSFKESFPAPLEPDPKVSLSAVIGVVIRIEVEPGQTVEPGQRLLVIETMKMESNVAAAVAGTVKAVHVKQGDPVKINQPLVDLE